MSPSKTCYRVNKEAPNSLDPKALLTTEELLTMHGNTVLYHEHEKDQWRGKGNRPVRIEIAPGLFGNILNPDESTSKHLHPMRLRLIRHTDFLVLVE